MMERIRDMGCGIRDTGYGMLLAGLMLIGNILCAQTGLPSIAASKAVSKPAQTGTTAKKDISIPYLSNLNAGRYDALFATYAAPMARSSYKLDQGYQFLFNDPESGVEMISADGPNFGLAIGLTQGAGPGGKNPDKSFRFKLKELFKEPIVRISYSDILQYVYQPFENIEAKVFFDVYSSGQSFMDVTVSNTGKQPAEIMLSPYHFYPSVDSVVNMEHNNLFDAYSYPLKKKADSWMKEHKIPFAEDLRVFWSPGLRMDSLVCMTFKTGSKPGKNSSPADVIRRSLSLKKNTSPFWELAVGFRTIRLQPGESAGFRVVAEIRDAGYRIRDAGYGIRDTGYRMRDGGNIKQDFASSLPRYLASFNEGFRALERLKAVDVNKIIAEDEHAYSRIPVPKLPSKDLEMLYWESFTLMRQCMMPAEGQCRTNYYVFSREPKWGWGYGGQVFHESLCMLAYVYMDPLSALNSQRVYIQRQQPDGYINYRTGPYLNETIPYDGSGKPTSSAPWFNYINLELYRVTGDRKFLLEAYNAGKKYYSWYVSNRDVNRNGLCEWGGEGELESVRDARVAVWDQVGRPMSFEGPDVNSMLVMEAKALSEMAKVLGNKAEEERYKSLAAQRSAMVEKYHWDPADGFYYNINKDNQSFTFRKKDDLKIREIIGFLPMWAGISSTERAAELMKTMRDPQEFWRPFGIPTLSAKSDYYNPIGYWNGPVWVQWEYLMYRALKDYGYGKEASELLKRVSDNMIWHLKQDHVFWEFYSPDEHQAGWNKTYIWAGIAARMLLDEYPLPSSADKKKTK